MKKILSMLIAISLIISLIPAAFAETTGTEPVEMTYTLNCTKIGNGDTPVYLPDVGESYYSNYGWKYFDMNDTIAEVGEKIFLAQVGTTANSLIFYLKRNEMDLKTPVDFALQFKAPSISGFYIPSMTVYLDATATPKLNWYMSKPIKGKEKVEDYFETEYQILKDAAFSGWANRNMTATTAIYTSSEEPIISAVNLPYGDYKFPSVTFKPILGATMTATVNSETTVALDLTDNKTATISTKVSGTTDGTNSVEMPVSNNFITYKSSNESVATVSADGAITAVAPGTAEITAQSSDGAVTSTPITVTVKVPDPTTYKFISDNVGSHTGLISTTNMNPYTFSAKTADGSTYYLNSTFMDYGTRKWKFFDVSDDLLKKSTGASQNQNQQFRIYYTADGYLQMNNSSKSSLEFAFSLQAPEVAGFYIPAINGYQSAVVTTNPYTVSITPDVYDAPFDKSVYEKKIPTNCTSPSWGEFVQTATNAIYTANTDKIVVALHTDNKLANKLYSITLTPILGAAMTTTVNSETAVALDLTDNKTATISTKVSGTTDGTNSVEMPVSNNFITYKSSDDTVATVSADGTITAVGGGTATIYAESSDKKYSSLNNGITVTVTAPAEEPEEPGEEVTDTTVSVAVQSENTEAGTVSWSGETIDEVEMGTTVTATATAKDGYVFRYWKNASDQVLSEKAEESFVINTNSAITAVFDKIDDTAATVSVELFNANGMPFDNKTVNKDTKFADAINGVGTPTYTGFGAFKHWSMYADESKIADDMLVKENTRAVAIFNEPTEKYTVKVNGTVEYSNVLYGKEVTVSSDASDFSCWKLGGKIVSYKTEYTFTVWGDADLTEVKEGSVAAAPVAALTTVGSNPLLIYSVPTGYTVVEAGILFGSTKNITIYSVDGNRAAAARGTGQFTAQANDSNKAIARGYLIFKNNTSGEIRILYAD